MKNDEAVALLADPQFLDKLYTYAYRHSNTSYEAEDLCSDMILAILKALRKSDSIQHFHAFAWTVAHRAYADYCERRKRDNARTVSTGNTDGQSMADRTSLSYPKASPVENPIEDMLEEQFAREEQQQQLREIFREMSFLSHGYRSVMVMYYLEERKISEIATSLGITENTVKQRLFWARKAIKNSISPEDVSRASLESSDYGTCRANAKQKKERKEMEQNNHNTNKTLQPVSLTFIGTGDPVGNNPSEKADRILSQNLIYLCKSRAVSAEELSRELNVPMPYIEQELEIQCRGVNGRYGTLRRAGQGKYISNILIVDREEYAEANKLYSKYASSFCQCLAGAIETGRERILSVKQLGSPKNISLLFWLLISRAIWSFNCQVCDALQDIFRDTESPRRPYTCVAIDACAENSHFYGNDGVNARQICGYSNVYVENLYGDRLQAHFHCNLNLSNDPLLLLTIRSVNGLALSALSVEEQEIAAKAIQCGYMQKNGGFLEPAIVVLDPDSRQELWNAVSESMRNMGALPQTLPQTLAQNLASELAAFMKKHVPAHLMGEYAGYNTCVASNHFFHDVVEECISRGILNAPKNPLGPEGVLMVLQK